MRKEKRTNKYIMKANSENKITPAEFNKMSSEEKIMKMASGFVPPSGKTKDEAMDLLLNKMEQSSPTKTFSLKRFLQAAAAIVILLLLVYSANLYFSKETVKTQFAEQTEINLPDGTQVTLNAGSKLVWNDKKFTKKRELTLSGEAYFDVKKGDEFVIKTKNGTVEILGTQLNIFSRENNFWVSCISGKVRVSTNNQQQIITPGEWVELSDNGLIKSNSETINNTISWKNGLFHFEDTPLHTIFDELERQFNVSIKLEGDASRLATIDFTNENLNEALDIVCIPMELNYEIRNNKITISEQK